MNTQIIAIANQKGGVVVGLIGLGVCLLVICALFLAGFLGLGPVPT